MITPSAPLDDDEDGMPRWVKVFILIGLLVALVAVVLLGFGGGDHGPGRHATLPLLLAGPPFRPTQVRSS